MSNMEKMLFQIIGEVFNDDHDKFDDDLRLMDLDGWDSLAHMHFITRIEAEYDVELTGDDIANMQTVADVKDVLNR